MIGNPVRSSGLVDPGARKSGGEDGYRPLRCSRHPRSYRARVNASRKEGPDRHVRDHVLPDRVQHAGPRFLDPLSIAPTL
jgi:hypothetical protein